LPIQILQRRFNAKLILEDEQHIIYINGSYNGDDELGKLIFDFKCKKSKDMNYKILSERVDYLKTEGESGMCKIMDDLIQKERAEERAEVLEQRNTEIAIKLLKTSKMTMSEIALMTDLTLEEVEKLSKKVIGK